MMNESSIPEISVTELHKAREANESLLLFDIREAFEKEIADIGGVRISLGELHLRHHEIPKDGRVVLYCRSGQRSGEAVRILRDEFGYSNVLNLRGGILEWAEVIDREISRY